MTNSIDNSQDVIYSRDVIARIADLRDDKDTYEIDADGLGDDWAVRYPDEAAELAALEALASALEGCGDWQYGEALIRDSFFVEYITDLIDDCYDMPALTEWPFRHMSMDYGAAAAEAEADYTAADFGGVLYLIRA